MQYRHLGNSGLEVSAVGLGTNNFGGRMDAEASAKVVDKAIDVGINLIDTANTYSRGKSEEYIGRAIEGKRGSMIALTVPTWAPALTQLLDDGSSWRASRMGPPAGSSRLRRLPRSSRIAEPMTPIPTSRNAREKRPQSGLGVGGSRTACSGRSGSWKHATPMPRE